MKKGRRILATFPLLFGVCLSGCSRFSVFPYTNDSNYPYIERDGEHFGKSDFTSVVVDTHKATLGDLDIRTFDKRTTMLFLLQESCQYCEAAEHSFLSFLKRSEVLAYTLYAGKDGETRATVRKILGTYLTYYPALSSVIELDRLVTPSIYLLVNPTKAIYVPFQNTWLNAQAFENAMEDLLNYTHVYVFSTYESYTRFVNEHDCVTIVDEDDKWYQAEVKDVAEQTDRYFAYIDIRKITGEDYFRFKSLSGDNHLLDVEKGGHVRASYSFTENYEEAVNFVRGGFNPIS